MKKLFFFQIYGAENEEGRGGAESCIVQIRVKTCAKEKAKYGGINSNYIDEAEHFLNLTGNSFLVRQIMYCH